MNITTDANQELRKELNFALPAVQYSDRHFDGIVAHDLSFTETKFLFHCLGNMDAKTGVLQSFTVSELAARFGVKPCNFYGEKGYIARLNSTSMVELEMKNHRVVGKVKETPTKRKRNKKYKRNYPLKVGLLHRDYLKMVFTMTRKNSVLRMFLVMALHTDKQTGLINTLARPVEWGKKIGNYAHIICNRAVDYLLDLGLIEGGRDYLVGGKIPAVAMAEGFLFLMNEKAKEENKKRKEGKSDGWDYQEIEANLLRFFGINAKGWVKQKLKEAERKLLFFLNEKDKEARAKGRKALEDFKEQQRLNTEKIGNRSNSVGAVFANWG